uniref:Uncharacterized protein n=1 Tax=Oryza brachyantha TaxID=4533 RepID=J3LCY8_ORYBR
MNGGRPVMTKSERQAYRYGQAASPKQQALGQLGCIRKSRLREDEEEEHEELLLVVGGGERRGGESKCERKTTTWFGCLVDMIHMGCHAT